MKFEIKNRWTGEVRYSCELEAEFAGKGYSIQLGAAVKAALKDTADLSSADLRSAYLSSANLSSADLRSANLESVRVDFFDVLLRASTNGEVPGLIAALKEGRVDESTSEGGCAFLVGTIANVKHCKYDAIPDLRPDSSRPAEVFFYAIRKGDTPENNSASKIALA